MGSLTEKVSAVIDVKPGVTLSPLRVHLDDLGDAALLANLTGCKVRIEQTYEPATAEPAPADKPSTRRAPKRFGRSSPQRPDESTAPARVLRRINAHPSRSFKVEDLEDLGLTKKRLNGILYRLYAEQHAIRRATDRRGAYQALDQKGSARPKNGDARTGSKRVISGETSGANVLAFLEKHAGSWMRAAEVTHGMGLPDDRKGAVAASLSRLCGNGQVQKNGTAYGVAATARRAEAPA